MNSRHVCGYCAYESNCMRDLKRKKQNKAERENLLICLTPLKHMQAD